jgi:hypothetical protein
MFSRACTHVHTQKQIFQIFHFTNNLNLMSDLTYTYMHAHVVYLRRSYEAVYQQLQWRFCIKGLHRSWL